jgi:hypothetical protein
VLFTFALWNNFIAQFGLMIGLSFLQYAYLRNFRPFDDSLMQKMEEFNEICTIYVIDIMFFFSEILPEPLEGIGEIFIAIFALNLCGHMFFMIRETVRACKLNSRKNSFKKKQKIWLKKQSKQTTALYLKI